MSWRFGEFELDPVRYELRRSGRRVRVPNLVFDLIAYLLEHRDRLVTRGELLAALWQGRAVTGASLTQAVAGARRVLCDDPDDPACIETVRGRGYRWVAEAVEVRAGACRAAHARADFPSRPRDSSLPRLGCPLALVLPDPASR